MQKKIFVLLLLLLILIVVMVGCTHLDLDFDLEDTELIKVGSENWDEFLIDEHFVLINNMWSTTQNTEQIIFVTDDGRYGWEWERANTDSASPNYPEVLLGVKPWGAHDFTTDVLPIQLGEIDSLFMEIDLDYNIFKEDGYWNLAFELWLTEDKPGDDVSDSITDEVMIWFDWKDGLWDWDPPVDPNAVDDGNYTYEYNVSESGWGDDDWIGGGWTYSQFRILDKGTIPEVVDLKPFLDYIQEELGRGDDIWLGALELGMEYEDNTAGNTIINSLNYEINGHRFESGMNK
ncbi:hypothetical protein [Natronospora cellulosivora (SeqCode)]